MISLSGGEPLAYGHIKELVGIAKDLGFRVTMITNGLLATEKADDLLAMLDGIAISFDGLAPTHNRIRGRADAFERASAAVKRLAGNGRPTAAAISLTREAIPDLPDLADHLVRLGAKALQVRPVARAGRAQTMSQSAFFNPADQSRLYLVVLALEQELSDHARVHCDLAPTRSLWDQRDAYAPLLATCEDDKEERPLADLVNPLVITDSGVLKPVAFDFSPVFDIGVLGSLSSKELSRYKREALSRFRYLIGSALDHLSRCGGFVDWFDFCTRLSERSDRMEACASLKTT